MVISLLSHFKKVVFNMKKIVSFISGSFLLLSLTSCASDNLIANDLQTEQVAQSFAVKPNADALIKKMVDKRFAFADKNKDKKLVFNEFKGLESEHEDVMKKMFDQVDTNKDAIVTYDEFLASDTAGIKSTLNQMFRMLDRNRNSFIDQNEELDMVVEVAHGMAAGSGHNVTPEQVKKDFMSYDTDKDGKLNFEEYQSPEMKYILMAPVDPYKNSSKSVHPVSLNRFINDIKNITKK